MAVNEGNSRVAMWNRSIHIAWPYREFIRESDMVEIYERRNSQIPLFADIETYNSNTINDVANIISYLCDKTPYGEYSQEDNLKFVISMVDNEENSIRTMLELFGVCKEDISTRLLLIHTLFTLKTSNISGGMEYSSENISNSYYDLDIKAYISTKSDECPNRRYISQLLRVVSNNRTRFSVFVCFQLGIPDDAESDVISKLKLTEKGSYYANLDLEDTRGLRITEKNAVKCSYYNKEYRICCNNERLFQKVMKVVSRYRSAKATPKYTKRAIKDSTRKAVWKHYNTYEVAKAPCFVCSQTIDLMNYQCGHIVSEKNGGEAVIKNLLPICGHCNRSMSTQHLFEYATNNYANSRCFELEEYKLWKMEESFVGLEVSSPEVLNSLPESESVSNPKCDILCPHIESCIEELCVIDPQAKVKIRDLHTEIKRFLRINHKITVTASDLKSDINLLGYKSSKIESNTYYTGISLKK